MISINLKSFFFFPFVLLVWDLQLFSQTAGDTTTMTVKKTSDFELDGKGSATEWNAASWTNMPQRKPYGQNLQTKVKALYSATGMYFLFACDDKHITSTMKADFMDLWTEDVVEVFIQSEENTTSYFEYELSPRNFELPILISNINGNLARWLPFHYEADRKTRRATFVAADNNWTAEFFIPYELLRPLNNYIPAAGTKWKGNFYRVDYDNKKYSSWTWQQTSGSFHDPEHFGTFVFE